MVVLQSFTREDARVAVGYNLNAIHVGEASGGNTQAILDNLIVLGTANEHKGKFVRFTSGTNDGVQRQLTSSAISSSVTTLTWVLEAADVNDGDTYELWDSEWNPTRIDNFITQAIHDATGYYFFWDEDTSLHGAQDTRRFDIPSNIVAIKKVQYRSTVSERVLHDCNAVWGTIATNITAAADTEMRRRGSASMRLTDASGFGTGAMATTTITSVDLSAYSHLEFWVRSTTARAANFFRIYLNNGSSDQFTGQFPALSANVWTHVRLDLRSDNQVVPTGGEVYRAITTLRINAISDPGQAQMWIDDVRVTVEESQVWSTLDSKFWSIDKEAQDLILSAQGSDIVGYNLIKLQGFDKPALPTTDATTIEVDPSWLTARATYLALMSEGGGAQDTDARMQSAQLWERRAALRAGGSQTMLTGVRFVR